MPPRSTGSGIPPGWSRPRMPKGGRMPAVRTPSGAPTGRTQLRDFQGRYKGAGVAWHGIDATLDYFKDVQRKTEEGAQRAAKREADAAVLWMQRNAPWEDRTGNARQGLQNEVMYNQNAGGDNPALRIYLGHTVDYGVHLELGMGGRFQIIRPALVRLAAKLPSSVVTEAGL